MKLSFCVPTLLMLVAASFARSSEANSEAASLMSTRRNLAENATRLSNGAQLAVEILSPAVHTNRTLGLTEATASVTIQGDAHVGKGTPDVAYIFVIDSSESTSSDDGACGSTLECVQSFFSELHNQTARNGSAKQIAVVDFDDHGWVQAGWQHPGSDGIEVAIRSLRSDGGTACSHALEITTLMVHQQKVAGTTVVIFAGDGLCNGGDESATVVSENVTDAADLLGDTGAIVHSIAIGDEVDCDLGNDLVEIPRNGGMCFSIPAPTALPTIIDDLIGTVLVDVEVNVNDGTYRSLTPSETGGTQLPHIGTVLVNFEATVVGLVEGTHKICIRATGAGQDALSDEISQVEDCRTVEILPLPSSAPSYSPSSSPSGAPSMQPTSAPNKLTGLEVFMTIAVCVCVLAFAAAIYKIRRLAPGTAKPTSAEANMQDAASEVSSEEISFFDEPAAYGEHQGVPIGTPNII